MNCLILVLLLLSCGNGGNWQNDGGCRSNRSNDRDRRDRNERDCGCRNDSRESRQESRLESRSFISYPGSNCGCEESRNNNGCDCAD